MAGAVVPAQAGCLISDADTMTLTHARTSCMGNAASGGAFGGRCLDGRNSIHPRAGSRGMSGAGERLGQIGLSVVDKVS